MINPAHLLFAVLLASCGWVQSQESGRYGIAGIDDDSAVEVFLNHLKEAVANDKRITVASMVRYPITINVSGHKETLRKKSQLLSKYELVFTSKVKEAIRSQEAQKLFVNYQGVVIGNGDIWFNRIPGSQKIAITAINN